MRINRGRSPLLREHSLPSVVREHRLLTELGERIRDVRQGPDGYLYVLTDDDNGKLLKVGLAQDASASRG